MMVKRLLWSVTEAMAPLFDILNIDGRIGRRDFWRAIGSLCVPILIAGVMDGFLFGAMPIVLPDLFTVMTMLCLCGPVIVLVCRRLRDTGRSAWLMLAIFVPILGWIWLLVCWSEPSRTCRARSAQPRLHEG